MLMQIGLLYYIIVAGFTFTLQASNYRYSIPVFIIGSLTMPIVLPFFVIKTGIYDGIECCRSYIPVFMHILERFQKLENLRA